MRKNKENTDKAPRLTDDEVDQKLIEIGSTFKELMGNTTTMERFSYEISMSKAQLAQYRKGKNMRMKTFLRLIYGLRITPEAFFRKVEEGRKK